MRPAKVVEVEVEVRVEVEVEVMQCGPEVTAEVSLGTTASAPGPAPRSCPGLGWLFMDWT